MNIKTIACKLEMLWDGLKLIFETIMEGIKNIIGSAIGNVKTIIVLLVNNWLFKKQQAAIVGRYLVLLAKLIFICWLAAHLFGIVGCYSNGTV